MFFCWLLISHELPFGCNERESKIIRGSYCCRRHGGRSLFKCRSCAVFFSLSPRAVSFSDVDEGSCVEASEVRRIHPCPRVIRNAVRCPTHGIEFVVSSACGKPNAEFYQSFATSGRWRIVPVTAVRVFFYCRFACAAAKPLPVIASFATTSTTITTAINTTSIFYLPKK